MKTLLGMRYGGYVNPQQLQSGGVSSGLAWLKRGRKRKEAMDAARDAQGKLGKKMGKGRLWGSLGGLGGGLLGAAALGALGLTTGGLGLGLASGLGTAAGKYFGSRKGYGGDFKTKDMMYGEEAGLGDIEQAGSDYRSQMGEDALVSGVKAGLTAGVSKGGGMYGKAAKWGEKFKPTDVAGGVAEVASGASDVVNVADDIGARAMRSQSFSQPEMGAGLDIKRAPDMDFGLDSIQKVDVPLNPDTTVGGITDISPEIKEAGLYQEAEQLFKQASDERSRQLASPYFQEIMGGVNQAPQPQGVLSNVLNNASEPFSAYTGTAAQNKQLIDAGGYGGTSIVDALKSKGLDSSMAGRSQMYQNLFPQQLASLMGGGMVRRSPRTLLNFIG